MKRLLIKTLLVTLILCAMETVAHAQFKVATVDLGRAFTNYWKFKEADVSLQELKADLAKSFDELKKSQQKATEEYNVLLAEANNQVLSSEERDRKKKAAEDKLRETGELRRSLEQFDKQAVARWTEQRNRVRDNLLTEIYAVVRSKGKAGNYAVVLDSAARTSDQTPVILYSSAEDITDSVLAQLNASQPTGAK